MFWLLVIVVLWVCKMCFLWSFVRLRDGDDFIKFPNMGDLTLIETDVRYMCEIRRYF